MIMRRLLILVIIMFISASVARGLVRERPPSSRAVSAELSVCGSALSAMENGETVLYVPFRRRGASGRDEGSVEKYALSESRGRHIWSSKSKSSRLILSPPCDSGQFEMGPLKELASDAGGFAKAAGLEKEQAERLAALYLAKPPGAPYPAAMTLAEGVLYVQTDDGLICALDAGSGTELWAFMPPQTAQAERVNAILSDESALPWLTAGGLTAEKILSGREERVFLWGTLGAAGKGAYCLDVTKPGTPEFRWAFEERDDGTQKTWGDAEEGTFQLGCTAAAPLAAPVSGKNVLILPSGAEAAARVWGLEPLTGGVRHVCDGMEGTELCFLPLGMQSAAGTLTRLTVADTFGGVQEFVRQNDFFRLNMRLDLREVTGENELELIASPLFCPLARESWLAFIAECPRGTIVAACPAPLGQRSWSDLPWRGGRWGWWHLYEGFHSLSSILVHDGLIFLLGKEENRSVVKTIDVIGSRLTETAEAPQNAVLTVADGRPVIAVPSTDGISAVRLSVQPSPSSYVLYTLFR